MSFWFVPHYPGYIMIPFSSSSTIAEDDGFEIENSTTRTTGKNLGLFLNITEQDLLEAGYNHKRSSWTEEEDKLLLKLAKEENLNWKEIGNKMNNRNSKMCYSRYRRLCYETKKRWTQSEEKTILECIQNLGEQWKKISEILKNISPAEACRTPRQIQQHYQFCLKADLNKSEWTLEQDLMLVKLLEKYGIQWKKIQTEMNSRSENQIKNRYFGRLLKISQHKMKKKIK